MESDLKKALEDLNSSCFLLLGSIQKALEEETPQEEWEKDFIKSLNQTQVSMSRFMSK